MNYEYVAIPDEDVPVAADPTFRHAITTYAGETNKTVGLWRAIPDDLLDYRRHEKTNTIRAILAHQSSKARLLILGNPIANRRQPVRVAEEMAMIDVISRGRLEAGFVRGVPYEISPANSNPVRMNEREWEALDMIIKAWALALRAVPRANAVWAEDSILQFNRSDIGVAIAVEGGLVTPVVRSADTKSAWDISAEVKDFAARARA